MLGGRVGAEVVADIEVSAEGFMDTEVDLSGQCGTVRQVLSNL